MFFRLKTIMSFEDIILNYSGLMNKDWFGQPFCSILPSNLELNSSTKPLLLSETSGLMGNIWYFVQNLKTDMKSSSDFSPWHHFSFSLFSYYKYRIDSGPRWCNHFLHSSIAFLSWVANYFWKYCTSYQNLTECA